jgi:starch synthase
MTSNKTILMLAAENDALPNAKVGGIGDVVRDLPKALAAQGCLVHVVIPSHGFLQRSAAREVASFPVLFGDGVEQVKLYRWDASEAGDTDAGDTEAPGVRQWVLDHPGFNPGGVGQIYCNDGNDRPFASDAAKYALFCAAVGQAILNESFGHVDILHLHDWHAAVLAVLREFDPHYTRLKNMRTVYSIHNLSLQGVRPLRGDSSALETWFPRLQYDQAVICDPRVTHCFNPMRAAIVLSDKVHAVSPTYAQEIQRPSQTAQHIYGGEGLETDLVAAAKQDRLEGILNGCEYPPDTQYPKLSKARLMSIIDEALLHWVAKSAVMLSVHWIARERLQQWCAKRERGMLITAVGRVTEQKVRLLRHQITYQGKYQSVLQHLLALLGDKGVFLMLGSGDADYEKFLQEVSGFCPNFIFLRGYSDELSRALYNSGDLFVMPSSFEPCGISQMLAMRAGQPCLVHGVGGLNDTVINGVSGFVFRGGNGDEQAQQMLESFRGILSMNDESPEKLQAIAKAAAKARFTWEAVAEEYLQKLY